MPVRVNCPFCQAAYTLPDQALGKQISCTQCGKAFAVGSPAPVTAPAAPPRLRPRTGRLRSTTEPRPVPARKGGTEFDLAAQSGELAARAEAPRPRWGGLCLVGCLIFACLFVVLLAGASIAGWWLIALAEAAPGATERIMIPWTAPAREPGSGKPGPGSSGRNGDDQ
jgi:hypothetical protein